MHPQAFLKTFWRLELRPQVFVAMSFDSAYASRFRDVIEPAIRAVQVGGVSLEPCRVDISKSGDSILTEIVDGIAHSQMVLADVSTVGRDAVNTSRSYRNANVMYEVGIALACRQPSEVLLIRDDDDPFLFDVSVVPHLRLNFAEVDAARASLTQELVARLDERRLVNDARVRLAVDSIGFQEMQVLEKQRDYGADVVWRPTTGSLWAPCVTRLLDKGIIVLAGKSMEGDAAYRYTELGLAVKALACRGLQRFEFTVPDAVDQSGPVSDGPGGGHE